MSSFDSILDGMQHNGESWSAHGPESWMQGRTLYGGLTAAIALHACERAVPDLPLLRAAQIAFIGPAAQDLQVQPSVLRRGKSVTYMGSDVFSEGKLVLRAMFAFGAARQSNYRALPSVAPACRRPAECPVLSTGESPSFRQNIDQLLAGDLQPLAGAPRGDLLVWSRHAETVRPRMAAVVALGDAMPPASFTRFHEPAIISSMTWGFEFFEPARVTGNGWHLLHAFEDGLEDGYAGQSMRMWDEDGRAILIGRQAVAVFG